MLPKKITISIISPAEDDAVYINSTLRNAGITVQSIWSKSHKDCLQALKEGKLHLIFIRTRKFAATDEKIIDEIKLIQKHIPVILIHNEVNQKTLTIALQMGAHDLISVDFPDRLTILTCRELGSYLKVHELYKLRTQIGSYQTKLQALQNKSSLAALTLIDGVIVESNPAANSLFISGKNQKISSNPILDYVHSGDQVLLRGALKAAAQGNFNKEDLVIKVKLANKKTERMNCTLEPYEHDGEKALRLSLQKVAQAPLASGNVIQLDPLTKIYHRQQFIQVAQEALQLKLDSGIRSLLFLKIDGFQELQNKIGILNIDVVLEFFAKAMIETVSKGDIFARFGNNSFTILTQKGTQKDVIAWAEHFQKHLKDKPFKINGNKLALACSVGIADWLQESDSFEELIQRAKDVCEEAEPGQIKVNTDFKDNTMRSASFDLEWVARIKQALLQNKFQLFQFPISSLRMNSVNMIDVYLRMQDEDGSLILPNIFMETAKRNNLVKSLDRWVIGASVKFCQKSPKAKLFVRLSKQSALDTELLPWCKKIIGAHKISTKNLVIQVSEEDINDLKTPIKDRLIDFRKNGFAIAVEHYGKDLGHLELLESFPLDYIKIDSTLIQGLTDNSDRQKIVKTLCATASRKKIATIAEQVETADTMAVLYQLGADYMQGKFTLEPDVVLGVD